MLFRSDRPKTVHFADTYRRNRLIGWLIKAYERGGQAEKVLPLLEQEADVSRNYEQLVDRLVLAGKTGTGTAMVRPGV